MAEGEAALILSRKELRKQKLMEYLAAKGKLKEPNPKPYLCPDYHVKKPLKMASGKENVNRPHRSRSECNHVQSVAAPSTTHRARTVFGGSESGNVKGSILTGREIRLTKTGPEQSKPNPVLTRCPTDASSKSNLKNQSKTGIRTADCFSSNAAVTKSNSRVSSSSNVAWSCSAKTISARISLGPLVKTRTGLVPAIVQPRNSQDQRLASRVTQAAGAEQDGKNKRENKKGHGPANGKPLKIGAPVMPQTVPWLSRTICLTRQTADTKTPKIPAQVIPKTEGKKQTAAQEERMRKLQEWRESKGISYKRPPMQVKPQGRCTAAMKEEDEAHSLICALNRSLTDCIKLLGEGCSQDQVKTVLSRLPAVSRKFAKYWICRARLMEQEGNLDVLPMFEEAVGVVLDPVDELRTVVFEILKKKDETRVSDSQEKEEEQIPAVDRTPENNKNPLVPPKPLRALIRGESVGSSIVKYKITTTPGGHPSQQKKPVRVKGQEVRFFTPVRRSVRISGASLPYPASLQDHDLCVASYSDLLSREDTEGIEEEKGGETSLSANNTPMYIYRENEALKDKVFVQLVYEDDI